LEELEPRQLLTILPVPTSTSVGVFEDELAFFSQSAETKFAATHTDGTQKLQSILNQFYTSINPNWYMLHYQLGSAASPYDYIINNTWGQDLNPALPDFYVNPAAGPGGVTSHEDWFEHSNGSLDPSTTGHRLVEFDGGFLMNLNSPGWRQYETTTLIQNMLASGSQGVFADAFIGPVVGFYVNQGDKRYDYGGPIPGPADPSLWPDGQDWLTEAPNYIGYIQGKLTAVGELLYGPGNGFAYVPNAGPMTTGWADIDYSAAKGLFAEGFAVSGGLITDGDWTMSMNRALRITSTSNPANADRMFIMQPDLSQTPNTPLGLQERSWAFGSYLLLKGDHTYINMYGNPTATRLEWYPEYQVNLGAAQDPGGMPSTVDGYYDPASQLYIRHFQNGIVLLNSSASSLVYNPAQTMQQVLVNGWGGGVRPGDIDPATNSYVAGSLTSQLVSTVNVGPYSSVILINQGVPVQTPPGGEGGEASVLPPFAIRVPSYPSISAALATPSKLASYSYAVSSSTILPESGLVIPDATTMGVGPLSETTDEFVPKSLSAQTLGDATGLPATSFEDYHMISGSLPAPGDALT
jgi:hypothetical protein